MKVDSIHTMGPTRKNNDYLSFKEN